ncbi:putative RND type efflux pump involved in aminoglycoside resistance (AdeT) [Acinetobacter sp. 8I-beige]|uniref:putative solute-binding protein n=1 Tax=Acinetobacter sp. 8I-beige TaxID=2653125 RepID=UPI0012F2E29D|nr:putative solute-binding protein [Acinetobacter sp. 8I-beige]VXA83065.1 putative RND type efflux pump involved in aminoglycoside resistance (AdeT) [Acinetobacter sp. 8I-beige]
MKRKGFFIISTLALCTFSSMLQAKQQVCVFDLLGKAGESYKFLEEWALVSKKWGAQVQLISFQDEDLADKAFQNDKCDAVYMTSMRARTYNKFAGSIDALGGVPSNKIAQKAVEYVLDARNTKRMTTTLQGESYEVAGIGLIGSAYIFVKDRSLNTIEKAQGKKFAILHYDRAQRVMVERVGAVPVMSDISNFIKKFNTGEVDVVAAPAYAYKPLEIEKGLGSKGAMLNFPVVNVTADLIVRPERFPAQFGEQSRQWFLQKIPQSFAMVQRLEAAIPNKIKMQLSKEDKEKYQRLLREGRIDLTKQGVYDPGMMRVLKKARCTVERTNFECSLGGE